MTRNKQIYIMLLIGLLIVIPGGPIQAQPALLDANPGPDAVLSTSPQTVTLLFDRALVDAGTVIRVFDADGERVDQRNTTINPARRSEVTIRLPPLIEGVYTVEYTAVEIGGSTYVTGSYSFSIDQPDPELALLSPVDGQAYQTGEVRLEMAVDFFEFGLFENRIRVYVDGELRDELRETVYTIRGLQTGVHEVRVVLARLDDDELAETETVVRVAVGQFDEELAGLEAASRLPPDPGLQLTLAQWAGVLLGTVLLLGIGLWLGRQPAHESG